MTNNRISKSVRLSEMGIKGPVDLIHLCLEYFIFFRWVYFKNRPRGNLFLIRSFMIVGVLATAYFFTVGQFDLVLEGIEIDPMIAFVGAAVVGFWQMQSSFAKKSSYCFNLRGEVLKAYGDQKLETARLLSVSLSLTLLTLDLWAHRAFAKLFASTLADAIGHSCSAEEQKEWFSKVERGKMSIRDARNLIEIYERDLIAELNGGQRSVA